MIGIYKFGSSRNRFAILLMGVIYFALSLFGSQSIATAQDDAADAPSLREQWIKCFAGPDRSIPFCPQAAVRFAVITAGGDKEDPMIKRDRSYMGSWSCQGVRVSTGCHLESFRENAFASQGGGGSEIAPENRSRIDTLLSNLPAECTTFPPAGRRLALQVFKGKQARVRIYDSANAPDEILELLRLMPPKASPWIWVPRFEADQVIQAHDSQHEGTFAVFPDGKTIVSSANNSPFKFWDVATHSLLRDFPAPHGVSELAFSPDGSLVIAKNESKGYVYKTHNWQFVSVMRGGLRRPEHHLKSTPQFTRDGRYVTFQSSESGLEVYDTSNWNKQNKLPGLPEGIRAYFPATKSSLVIIHTQDGSLATVNDDQQHELAKLDDGARIQSVSYSSDETQVAVATVHRGQGDQLTRYRIRIWELETGRLKRELLPFEQNECERVDCLVWSLDSCYLIAATRTDTWGTGRFINIWNLETGRHRAALNGFSSRVTGMAILPDRQTLVAGSEDGTIRFWNLNRIIKEVREFEASLNQGNDAKSAR